MDRNVFSYHQRSFLRQKMGTNTDSHLGNVQRVRGLGTLGPKWDASIKSLTSVLRQLQGTVAMAPARSRENGASGHSEGPQALSAISTTRAGHPPAGPPAHAHAKPGSWRRRPPRPPARLV